MAAAGTHSSTIHHSNADIDVPVLIVGAGPVGLALAADLGSRGVSCILVETRTGKPAYHAEPDTHPR